MKNIIGRPIVCAKVFESSLCEIGDLHSHFGDELPDGWLVCDGSEVPFEYQELRDFVFEYCGSYNLPDLTKEKIR